MIDESAFAKKGDMSAGVARQLNGRLGKTDNSLVDVFAAVTGNGIAALVEGELYVPDERFAEPERCLDAGISEDIEFRTKGEMALSMIHHLRSEGLRFAYTAFDADYEHLPWLLRELEGGGEIFLTEVHSDQAIYHCDPAPAVPERQSAQGRAPRSLRAKSASLTVVGWVAAQSPFRWRRLSVRERENGEIIADYLTQRVWLWNGEKTWPRCWHLLVRRELDGSKLKFCLSNAKPRAN